MEASIDSIETFGLVDGPGIRTVIFLNKCNLRCKYCHNPETWVMKDTNYTSDEIVNRVLRNKSYYKNNGGVTFSGGEPLLQPNFVIELCKRLHELNIHIAIDTAGIGTSKNEEVLKNVDLVLFDIKDITEEAYKDLTGGNISESKEFIKLMNKLDTKIWIRQVIVPGLHDNNEFMEKLCSYIKENFKVDNIDRIEFLPYHTMGITKYKELGLDYPYANLEAMDKVKCNELYDYFMKIYKGA